jgi:cytochrome c peroxidase
VLVSHAGTNELSVLDAEAMRGDLVHVYVSPLALAIPDDPRLGSDRWRRVKLPGTGPRGLAAVGSQVVAAQYFSDSLAVVDLTADKESPPAVVALGPEPQLTRQRRGEILFHDANICYQQWQSCASCHPDGRTDVLNWDLLNDGIGNFKNTKSLLLAHKTPPAMAEAVRQTAEDAVRAGLSHILFVERPWEDAAAIDAYLRALQPVPSPHRVDGRLTAAAERGKLLFESNRVGCHKCHPAPLYTDLKMHDVKSRSQYELVDRFDTPTLVEVWRTAPYLHDGRYLTVKELLVDGQHGSTRGRVEDLTEQEIDDLVEFVLSL